MSKDKNNTEETETVESGKTDNTLVDDVVVAPKNDLALRLEKAEKRIKLMMISGGVLVGILLFVAAISIALRVNDRHHDGGPRMFVRDNGQETRRGFPGEDFGKNEERIIKRIERGTQEGDNSAPQTVPNSDN